MKHRIRVYGVLNAMNLVNGLRTDTVGQRLADGIQFTGPVGWYSWLRGVRRSDSNPNQPVRVP